MSKDILVFIEQRDGIIQNVSFELCGAARELASKVEGAKVCAAIIGENASKLAKRFGMSEAMVGLTIVAIGTSLPELVTSVVAAIKKENDMAVGNVIGSNIFNALLILGATSTILPLNLSNDSLIDLVVLFASGLFVFIISRFSKNIKRWQGVLFVLIYIVYFVYVIVRG